MARNFNSDRNGSGFSEETKRQVWNKAQIVADFDPSIRRKDLCNAYIDWNQYGVTIQGGFGWEIDHIIPVSKGGSDDLRNLQPLQWQNNRKKGDDYPASNYCVITSK